MNIKPMVLTSLFAALTAVGAMMFFVLPFSPVAITLQSMVTLLAGLILGPRLGALSQVIYIGLGLVGLPVFSKGQAGIGVLLGPSGGYLVGFVVAAYLIGKLTEGRDHQSPGRLAVVFVLASVVIYMFGVVRLVQVTGMSLSQGFVAGVYPFIPGDLLKITTCCLLGSRMHRVLRAANLGL